MGRSQTENIKHLNKLVSGGTLDQYFDLDDDAIKEVMSALSGDSADNVADILSRSENISRGGEGITPLFAGAYDNQIEEQGKRIVDNHFRNLEAENIQLIDSFKKVDFRKEKQVNSFINKLRSQIEDIEELPDLSGFIQRKNKMLEQLKDAEESLAIPANLEEIAVKLVEERGKDPEDMRTTKIIDKWGRGHKRAIVTWGKRGIMAVKFLDKPVPKSKKPKLEYAPTKKEFKEKTPEQILSRKGEPFTVKEKLFVESRKNKSFDVIYNDYVRSFGKIRTKTEVRKLLGEVSW